MKFVLWSLSLGLAVLAGLSNADVLVPVLPNAFGYWDTQIGPDNAPAYKDLTAFSVAPTDLKQSSHQQAGDSLQAMVISGGTPAIETRAQAAASSTQHAYASAALNYFVEFTGPANVWIPIKVDSNMQAVFSGTGKPYNPYYPEESVVDLLMTGYDQISPANGAPSPFMSGDFYIHSRDRGIGCPADLLTGLCNNGFGEYQLLVRSNTLVWVTLHADVEVNAGDSGTAYIDPHFAIDSSFADALQFQIVISPGVDNGPAAQNLPEPWAPLLSCTALLVMLGVRAKRT